MRKIFDTIFLILLLIGPALLLGSLRSEQPAEPSPLKSVSQKQIPVQLDGLLVIGEIPHR